MQRLKNLSLGYLLLGFLLVISFTGCGIEIEDPIDPPGPETLACDFFSSTSLITLVNDPDLAVDYIVDCRAFTNADLVIEPGVVIEFTAGSGLEIGDDGSIVAQGTASEPIVLTGVDKIAGSWLGLLNNSANVQNVLSHVTISYGGGGSFNSNDDRGSLIMWASSHLSIENSTFSHSASYGINLPYNELTIPTFANNTLTSNEVPINLEATYLHLMDASNDFTGNTNDYLEVGCDVTLTGSYTWQNVGVPYRVLARDYGITRDISIPDQSSITVEPGVVMQFGTDTGLATQDGSSFAARGTASEPITFTGVDGAPGAWRGLSFSFSKSVNNLLDNVLIEYAGSNENDAGIYMWADPKLTVTNSTFRDIDGCGIRHYSPTFSNPNFTGSGNTFINVSGGERCGY